ncbi:DUF983 domain-containing protein [Caulobacter sp.]|uniref:DUF983 domain-containing protein n=1 Tax=Caulobacter sp. TaxID=78 RepID=UPI001B0D9B3C|nr:DUF983 domain-containing protein [Caulobacter sp.]MBO9544861.1 DUF983 domain-containing protein [Caulobacter sp.]
MSETQPSPSLLTGLKRGLMHRCPNCGDGRLYMRYLKVDPECEACGHELGCYPADDGPAYFTILLVGHLLVAPLLFFPWIWEASPWLVAPLTLIPLAVLTLALLPRVKGGVIGALWAIKLRKAEDTPC